MKRITFTSLLIFIFSISLSAQSLKEVSPAEKKILDKPISIIQSLLDQFGNNDWGEPNTNNDGYELLVPIGYNGAGAIPLTQDFERVYRVQENSRRFYTVLKPMLDREKKLNAEYEAEYEAVQQKSAKEQEESMSKPTPAYDSLIALGKKSDELSEIDVYAYINKDLVEGKQVNDPDINVRGASLVTKLNSGYFQKENWTSYFLAFGNWKSVKPDKYNKCYYYKFKNTKTSSIQNIVIVMTGAPDRMKELMNKLDWKALNGVLTN